MLAANSRLYSALAWGGLVTPFLFWSVVAVLGWLYPGYSHVSDPVSILGAAGAPDGAPNTIFQNANFVVNGLLIVGFALALRRALGSWPGPALVAIFGIGIVGSGLFPCDLSCSDNSVADQLHNVFPSFGFLAIIVAFFVLSRHFRGDSRWAGYSLFTLATGVVALAFFVLYGLAVSGVVSSLTAQAGLLQRLFAGTAFIWILATARRLRRLQL